MHTFRDLRLDSMESLLFLVKTCLQQAPSGPSSISRSDPMICSQRCSVCDAQGVIANLSRFLFEVSPLHNQSTNADMVENVTTAALLVKNFVYDEQESEDHEISNRLKLA